VETGRHRDRDLFDLLVVVSANPGLQRLRLEAQRGMSPEIVARWLHAQLPLGEKEAQADLLILNDGTREALRERVHELARRLRDWPLPPRPDTGPIRESP
jgi:dephospho-CoA kinase